MFYGVCNWPDVFFFIMFGEIAETIFCAAV